MGLTRRDAFRIIAGTAVSGLFFAVLRIPGAKALPRPPGALTEKSFLRFCTRCYRCIDVCPADALRPAGLLDGIPNLGTPVLDWKKCIFCQECIRACPTGAIAKIPKDEIDIGNAAIDRDTCLDWTRKRRCGICYKACRYDAIKLEDRRAPVVVEENCTGCGLCEQRCPTDPKSIAVVYDKVRRFEPPESRFLVRPEDRVEPYEFEPPGFGTWFAKRLESLARYYGLIR